jgi:hypothetical protein
MAVAFASALVSPNGAIVSGNNMKSCKRVSEGQYLLTYQTPFSSPPGVSAVTMDFAVATVNIMADNTCEVILRKGAAGTYMDGGFSFTAVGNS